MNRRRKEMHNTYLELNDVIVSYDSVVIEIVKLFKKNNIMLIQMDKFDAILKENGMTIDYKPSDNIIKKNNFVLKDFFLANHGIIKRHLKLFEENNVVRANFDTHNVLSSQTIGYYVLIDNLFIEDAMLTLYEIIFFRISKVINKDKMMALDILFNHLTSKSEIAVEFILANLICSSTDFKERIAKSFENDYHKNNNRLYDEKMIYLKEVLNIGSVIFNHNQETAAFASKVKAEQEKTNKISMYSIGVRNLFTVHKDKNL